MNELARVEPQSNVQAYRASTEAADLCREIVVATSSQIQGRRYVSVEGWQAIARAHGCAAGACDVERVDGGVRAIGEVRDILTGQLVARAEGFVGEDETTWFGGKDKKGKVHDRRLDYAIRAMAQTRAMSRACRSAFAHVVVMMNAGLATTPAEEVPQEGFDRETGEIIEAPRKVPDIQRIKNGIREMKKVGDAATSVAAFETILNAYVTQRTTLEEYVHEWWTGKDRDGNEFESIPAWIKRRREELEQQEAGEPSDAYTMCAETLEQCTSAQELAGWFKLHAKYVETLDGEESRKIQQRYDELEESLKAVANVSAG